MTEHPNDLIEKGKKYDKAIRVLKETLQPLRKLSEFQNYHVKGTTELIAKIETLIKS